MARKCIKTLLTIIGTTFSFGFSLYVTLTYMVVILPNSAPTSNQLFNWALIALNYLLHFLFGGLYATSLILTSLSDPGAFSTHFETKRIGPVEAPDIEEQKGDAEARVRFEIIGKQALKEYESKKE